MVTYLDPSTGSLVTGHAPTESKNVLLVRAAEGGIAARLMELLEDGGSPNSSACRRRGKFTEARFSIIPGGPS